MRKQKQEKVEEVVTYSRYLVCEDRPSRLGLKEQRSVELGFECPRCGTLCRTLRHGQESVCPSCDLEFQALGNGLHCWGYPLTE